jgi:hypothetical protein
LTFFVTRVAGSADDLFAADFVAFFGVTFFSATWFTSLSSSGPEGPYDRRLPASWRSWPSAGVSRVTKVDVTSVTETM